MMNSIRPDALASLLICSEAKNGNRPVKGERQFRDLSLESTVSSKIGMHGVIGDRMVGSWSDMNQGSRTGKGTAFMVCRRPEELYPGGDRASVVARKRGNARGAKGRQEGGSVKDRTKEQQPSAVPETAQQGGDIRARWVWVEPAVWTERMLATLETGIEGGKCFG
jgi:hypothetical protein